MAGLPGPRSPFVDSYLRTIADRMIALFSIDRTEAEGRIATDLGSWDLESSATELFLGHEDPDYWAHSIYYGPIQWWTLPPAQRTPRPWP
jgi:hypothetical protein